MAATSSRRTKLSVKLSSVINKFKADFDVYQNRIKVVETMEK